MKAVATFILGAAVATLVILLAFAILLDRLSSDYNLFSRWNSYSSDKKTHWERYLQFTNEPGVLLFGFKEQESTPNLPTELTPPFSLMVEPILPEELASRTAYLQTAEGQSKSKFFLGVSRMATQPKGQNFRGDYVSVKISAIYVTLGVLILLLSVAPKLLYRKTEQGAAANR